MSIWRSAPILVAALAVTGCVNREAQDQAKRTEQKLSDTRIPVTTESVMLSDFPETVEITGQIATGEDTQIGATAAGKLVAVYVKEGDSVSAGQTIASIEQQDSLTRLQQARAQVDSARSQLQQAINESKAAPTRTDAGIRAAEIAVKTAEENLRKLRAGSREAEKKQAQAAVARAESDMKVAKQNVDRQRRLFAEGAIARADLERAENQYEVSLAAYESAIQQLALINDPYRDEDIRIAEQQVASAREQLRIQKANQITDVNFKERIEAARANLRSAEEGVRLAQKALSDTIVRAPFSGRVVGKPLQPGTVVAPGTSVARLVSSGGLYFEADVPEITLPRVLVGSSVSVTIDALGGAVLSGSVAAINPVASDVARLYKVRIVFAENLPALKPGMFGKGQLRLGSFTNIARVPADAVVRDGENTWVYIVENSKAKRAKVKVLANPEGDSVVQGLEGGQSIVVKGQALLFEGVEVKEDDGTKPAPESSEAPKE